MNRDQEQSGHNFALVAECDGNIRALLDYLFEVVCHWSVRFVPDSAEAVHLLKSGPRPQVVVACCKDMNSGYLELIRAAAALGPKPIVVLVDYENGSKNCVKAFLAGADDVVRIPFTFKEFALRLRARLTERGQSFDFDFGQKGDWEAEAHVAYQAGLTFAETQVVRVLFQKDGQIVSRNELSRAIDNRSWAYGDRKFDVHVARIRKKLNGVFGTKIALTTVRAAGYQLTVGDLQPGGEAHTQK